MEIRCQPRGPGASRSSLGSPGASTATETMKPMPVRPVTAIVIVLAPAAALLACGPVGDTPRGTSSSAPQTPLSEWARAFQAAAPAGDYLGLTSPGNTPELFGPGLIDTGLYNRDVAITPGGDQIFFGVMLGRFNTIFETHRGPDGRWSVPEVAPFATDPLFYNLEPAVHPDGSRLMFLSTRVEGRDPEPGETSAWVNQDIWVVDREGDGWGEPYNLGAPVNSPEAEFFPSLTREGTLYFTRGTNDGSESYIYRSRLEDGAYQEPERLGPEVNSTPNQYNAFVSPDESYLIFCTAAREDGMGGDDYWVSFREPDDSWVGPINMGEVVNTPAGGEFSPYVSPDGRYFFFMSTRPTPDGELPARMTREFAWRYRISPENGNADIYWVDAGFIQELKPGG